MLFFFLLFFEQSVNETRLCTLQKTGIQHMCALLNDKALRRRSASDNIKKSWRDFQNVMSFMKAHPLENGAINSDSYTTHRYFPQLK